MFLVHFNPMITLVFFITINIFFMQTLVFGLYFHDTEESTPVIV